MSGNGAQSNSSNGGQGKTVKKVGVRIKNDEKSREDSRKRIREMKMAAKQRMAENGGENEDEVQIFQ